MIKKYMFTIIATFSVMATVFIGVYAYNKYISIPKNEEEDIMFKSTLPDGYLAQIPKKDTPIVQTPIQAPQPEQEESIVSNEPIVQKSDTIQFSNFIKKNEIDEIELEKARIRNLRISSSLKNQTYLIEKQQTTKEKTIQQTVDNTNDKNSIVYDKDFGKDFNKDLATNRVDLSRVITADNFFSAILVNSLNSHLEGKVIALLINDVFGSHGRDLLLPKGSKFFGIYKPLETVEAERLAINWLWVETPEGRRVSLTLANASDIMGRSGVVGELDKKYWERYGLAFSLSTFQNVLGYWATKNTKVNEQDENTTFRNEILRDYKNDASSITQQVMKDSLKIKPVMTLNAGDIINISPMVDIWFNQNKDEIKIELLNL